MKNKYLVSVQDANSLSVFRIGSLFKACYRRLPWLYKSGEARLVTGMENVNVIWFESKFEQSAGERNETFTIRLLLNGLHGCL